MVVVGVYGFGRTLGNGFFFSPDGASGGDGSDHAQVGDAHGALPGEDLLGVSLGLGLLGGGRVRGGGGGGAVPGPGGRRRRGGGGAQVPKELLVAVAARLGAVLEDDVEPGPDGVHLGSLNLEQARGGGGEGGQEGLLPGGGEAPLPDHAHGVEEGTQGGGGRVQVDEARVPDAELDEEAGQLVEVGVDGAVVGSGPGRGGGRADGRGGGGGEEAAERRQEVDPGGRVDRPGQAGQHAALHGCHVLGGEVAPAEAGQPVEADLAGLVQLHGQVQGREGGEVEGRDAEGLDDGAQVRRRGGGREVGLAGGRPGGEGGGAGGGRRRDRDRAGGGRRRGHPDIRGGRSGGAAAGLLQSGEGPAPLEGGLGSLGRLGDRLRGGLRRGLPQALVGGLAPEDYRGHVTVQEGHGHLGDLAVGVAAVDYQEDPLAGALPAVLDDGGIQLLDVGVTVGTDQAGLLGPGRQEAQPVEVVPGPVQARLLPPHPQEAVGEGNAVHGNWNGSGHAGGGGAWAGAGGRRVAGGGGGRHCWGAWGLGELNNYRGAAGLPRENSIPISGRCAREGSGPNDLPVPPGPSSRRVGGVGGGAGPSHRKGLGWRGGGVRVLCESPRSKRVSIFVRLSQLPLRYSRMAGKLKIPSGGSGPRGVDDAAKNISAAWDL